MTVTFKPIGLLTLKPFRESDGGEKSLKKIYAGRPLLVVFILAGFIFSVIGVLLILNHDPRSMVAFRLAIASNTILAGLEWHYNLKARSLNELYGCLMFVLLLQMTGD